MNQAQKAAEEHTRQIVKRIEMIREVAYRLHSQQAALAAESRTIVIDLMRLEQELTVLPTPTAPNPPPMAIPLRQ